VADRWQGQGVGSALVRQLIRRAQARGVVSVTMDVLHANHQVLAMIADHWATARIEYGADCLTARARLPQPGQRQLSAPYRGGRTGGRRLTDRPAGARHAGRMLVPADSAS
jgi:hypothetical protein